jgi:SAM-dependent methyltransferase
MSATRATTPSIPQGNAPPSDWVTRWAALAPAGGRVLDVACGGGRHVRWWAARGCAVTGIDRDAAALAPLQSIGRMIVADLESGPWPLAGTLFDVVVVTNYLWRPLFASLRASLAPGGLLIYETFAHGQASIGRPSRPEFLLQPGELLGQAQALGLRVVGFEDGFEDGSPSGRPGDAPRFVQRLAACRPPIGASEPVRYPLPPPVQQARPRHGGRLESPACKEA